jgi:hypothetical protein
LSLWIGRNGALMVGCYAGCEKAAVLTAAGLTYRDLFPTGRMPTGESPRVPRRIVATYDYCDEAGALLYQTVRYEPKDFRQRRPGGPAAGWIYNLDGVRRVLYRLPELMATDGPVWIVEGEKDADALWRLGLVATTRAMGAKSPWLPDYSAALHGRDAYIVPDNDQAGRDGAAMVAGHLVTAAGVRSLRIVRLHGLPEHGDVSVWLADRPGWNDVALAQALIAAARWHGYRLSPPDYFAPGTANAG